MNKKGFTLMELLVSNTLTNSKNELSLTQKNMIEDVAEIYYLKEGINEDITCVNISTLVDKGYVDKNDVLDPKTRKTLPGSVKIEITSTNISYNYQENVCSN